MSGRRFIYRPYSGSCEMVDIQTGERVHDTLDMVLATDYDQLRTERDRLIEGHRLIDGFAQSILEEPTNPNHVSMRAGNIRSWIRINTTLNKEATDEQ